MTRKPTMLVVVALLIAYGSLYPFNFTVPPEGVIGRLFAETLSGGSRGDILGNIGLFVPWGLLGILAIAPERAISRTLGIGFLLALGLQIIQVWIPSRTPAMYDAIWNMGGCLIGMVLGHYLRRTGVRSTGDRTRDQTALWLLGAWILVEWLPLIPSLDFQLIKNQLKDLITSDFFDIGHLAISFATSLLFGELLRRRFSALQSAILLPVIVAAMLCGKLMLIDTTLTAAALAGHVGGILGWWVLVKYADEQRTLWVVATLIAAYSLQALSPFELKTEPSTFNFLPFAGMLEGAMLDNARSLAKTLLLFFTALFLLRDSGSKTSVATVGLALWVLLLEGMQMLIAGRSASITESLLVLLAGLLVTMLGSLEHIRATAPQVTSSEIRQPSTRKNSVSITPQLMLAAVVVAGMVSGLKLLLMMPSIPYNVRELFRADGNVLAISAFVLALLWIGAGAAWLSDRLRRSSMPALLFGPLTLLVALISLALLWSGVTSESISDIVGSPNRYWFVINRNVWGDFWRELFVRLNEPSVINLLETCVRYWALYTPVVVTLGLLNYALIRDAHAPSRSHGLTVQISLGVCAVLLLWLCKAIAFDWSSTDNLNELIARDGEWGLGGGGYLYALLCLICLNAILLAALSASKPGKALLTVLYSVLAVPTGWWLINQGLEQQVEKYGNVFSGVQFLLGPDRKHLLGSDQLLLRWTLLQSGSTLLIGFGLWIGRIGLAYQHGAHEEPAQ